MRRARWGRCPSRAMRFSSILQTSRRNRSWIRSSRPCSPERDVMAEPAVPKEQTPRFEIDIGDVDPDHPTRFWKSCWVIARSAALVLFDLKSYGARNVPRTGGALLLTNHQS